jgi:enterochelin esterase-like enzyme
VIDGLDVICTEFVTSSWVITGLVMAAVIIVLIRRRRRPRPALRWGLSILAVTVAVVSAGAVSVNAYYAYLPTIDDVRQAASGDQQWIDSSKLSRLSPSTARRAQSAGLVVRLRLPADPADGFGATSSVAYLPPQYFAQPAARFPVLYLFHGSPGQASDWFHAGRAAQEGRAVAASGHPVIVVAPRMSRSWTDDPECVDGKSEKVETHFVDRVIPDVDSALRTRTDREDRIVAGMSAGGYCALNLGLRHRDLIATIIDLSGDAEVTHDGGAATLFGRTDPAAAAAIAANSPATYSSGLASTPQMRIWLDSGSADSEILPQMSRLYRSLTADQQQVQWRVRPGGHTYWVWTSAMREALPWALGASPVTSRPPSRPGP